MIGRRKGKAALLGENQETGKCSQRTIAGLFKDLDLSSGDKSDAVCPKCGWVYSDDDGVCDGCDSWMHKHM